MIRFAPQATELLRRHELSRRARSSHVSARCQMIACASSGTGKRLGPKTSIAAGRCELCELGKHGRLRRAPFRQVAGSVVHTPAAGSYFPLIAIRLTFCCAVEDFG